MESRELTESVRETFHHAGTCWFASADAEGIPCVAPKELFTARGNEVIFADTNDTRCSGNVRVNPYACLSVVDVFTNQGVAALGSIEVIDPDHERYGELDALLRDVASPDMPIGVIYIATILDYEAVPVPVLQKHPHRTRGEMMRQTWQDRGVY